MDDFPHMDPKHTQPGRRWVVLKGPHAGRIGHEYSASAGFDYVGLVFPDESKVWVFSYDDLEFAD
jgi:hypothetical protein